MTIKQIIQLVIIALFFGMAATISILSDNLKKTKSERTQFKQNIETLNKQIFYYVTQDSQSVATITSLAYSVDEYKRFNAENMETIAKLQKSLKTAKNTTNVTTITETKIVEKLIKNDSTTCFDYESEFDTISGCFDSTKIAIKAIHVEKIFLIINTDYRHKFLFFKWGDKITSITGTSKNKESKITELKYQEIKKGRN